MSAEHSMRVTSKLAQLVQHMQAGKPGEWLHTEAVAKVMECDPRRVVSLCAIGVRKGFLVMTWLDGGLHYGLNMDAKVQMDGPLWMTVIVCDDDDVPAVDEDTEFLRYHRTWVKAEGQPLPFALGGGAVRSVFDLGGAAHG
jgi:hypothetical protein